MRLVHIHWLLLIETKTKTPWHRFGPCSYTDKDSKSFAHADARELMQEKEPMSRTDFETILWPEIKEKIIPHLGNEFKAYDRNKELEGKFL